MQLTKRLLLSTILIVASISGCATVSNIASSVSNTVSAAVADVTPTAAGVAGKNLQDFQLWLRSSPPMQAYKVQGIKFSDMTVKETTISGMYALHLPNGKHIAYASSDTRYIVDTDGWREISSTGFSAVLDKATQLRLDRERIFSQVRLGEAIAYKFGNGEKAYLLFSAIDCSFSKVLEIMLARNASNRDYNATIYVFPSTLQGNANAERRVKDIWCSTDPAGNWRKALTQNANTQVSRADSCDYDTKLAHRNDLIGMLRITGYPAFAAPGGINGAAVTQGFSTNPAAGKAKLDALLK